MARYDAVGMFWEDLPSSNRRGESNRVMPEIPDTGWTPPQTLPNLSSAASLAIDTETYDPDLIEAGPGWARHSGEIVGVSLATPDHRAWYFPIRHRVEAEHNLNPDHVLAWLKDTLKGTCPKIGANLLYDVGWLAEEGVEVNGPLYDVQYAEALLNSETPSVALDSLGEAHLGLGKDTSLLYQWCADYYGGAVNDRQRANIYRAPPRLVGPYAEADARIPLQVLQKQWPLLEKRGVLSVFDLECRLIRLLMAMRFRGVPVNIAKAEQMHEELAKEIDTLEKRTKKLAGFEVGINNAGGSLRKAFDHFRLRYPTTPTGNPSFTEAVLKNTRHEIAELVLLQRQKFKLRGTFIESYILNSHVNGRLHCEFHPLKSVDKGARSGRFASSHPNLQNIPVRSKEGKKIRSLFGVPGQKWRKYDYSQIEYRLLAHHAVGPGSDEIRQRYRNDPSTDYHAETGAAVEAYTGQQLERRPIKNINFGLTYGMGKEKLISTLGAGGAKLYNAYHKALPFVRETAKDAKQFADNFGYISTILGRRSDFPFFGPHQFDSDAKVMLLDEAIATYGMVKRAFTHKALNRRLQGGAADMMKKAMVDCFEQGIFAETGIPNLTVHDEVDFEDDGSCPEHAWQEMIRVMETCIPDVSVPIKVDGGVGAHWGDVE